MVNKTREADAVVLVGVLKNQRDLKILLQARWYRIPKAFLPTRPFNYIAFYQPANFGAQGKRISYYGRVIKQHELKRIDLLPDEPDHPHAQKTYFKFQLADITKLARPIKNIIPRRISFGFTTLAQLRQSQNILELYGVPPTEQIVAQGLKRIGIPLVTELPVGYSSGRFRIDLVVACRTGLLAIECDNAKAHGTRAQHTKDVHKDTVLRYHDWRVLRLTEAEIVNHFDRAMARIEFAIASLGGLV